MMSLSLMMLELLNALNLYDADGDVLGVVNDTKGLIDAVLKVLASCLVMSIPRNQRLKKQHSHRCNCLTCISYTWITILCFSVTSAATNLIGVEIPVKSVMSLICARSLGVTANSSRSGDYACEQTAYAIGRSSNACRCLQQYKCEYTRYNASNE